MSENIFPPYNIILDNYQYVLKARYANGDLSYRCPQRQTCKIIIRIKEEDLKSKYNKEGAKLDYKIVSTVQEHTCNKKDNSSIINAEMDTLGNIKNLATALIKQNINKKLSFHINMLNQAKIPLTKKQTKYLLQKLREEHQPSDDEYLKELGNIKIDLEDNIAELKNLPFFFGQEKIVNFSNNNKIEEFLIFTTPFHFKLLSETRQIFKDGTFKFM